MLLMTAALIVFLFSIFSQFYKVYFNCSCLASSLLQVPYRPEPQAMRPRLQGQFDDTLLHSPQHLRITPPGVLLLLSPPEPRRARHTMIRTLSFGTQECPLCNLFVHCCPTQCNSTVGAQIQTHLGYWSGGTTKNSSASVLGSFLSCFSALLSPVALMPCSSATVIWKR